MHVRRCRSESMRLPAAFYFAVFFTAGWGQPELFPYGTDHGDQELSGCDDCHSGAVSLQYDDVQMYGNNESSYAVHSNGYITFPNGSVVNSYSYNPSPLDQISGDPMIAAFWADADLEGSGTVYYRESSNAYELARAAELIQAKYWESQYEPSSMVVVTWKDVGYFDNHTDKLNTYQLVIATGGTPMQSYAIFLFECIQWTTGDDSGGTGGLGGNRAQVGHSSGDGSGSGSMTIINGSSSEYLLHLPYLSNIGYPVNNGYPGIFVSCLESESVRNLVDEQQDKPPMPTSRTVYEQQDKTPMPTSRTVYEQQDKTTPPVYEQQDKTPPVYEQQDKTPMPTSRTVYEQQDKTTPPVYEQQDKTPPVYEQRDKTPMPPPMPISWAAWTAYEQRNKPASEMVYQRTHKTPLVYEQQDKPSMPMPTPLVYEQLDNPPTSRTVYEQQDKPPMPTSRMVYEQQDKTPMPTPLVYEQQDKTPSKLVYQLVYQSTNDCPGSPPSYIVHEQHWDKM